MHGRALIHAPTVPQLSANTYEPARECTYSMHTHSQTQARGRHTHANEVYKQREVALAPPGLNNAMKLDAPLEDIRAKWIKKLHVCCSLQLIPRLHWSFFLQTLKHNPIETLLTLLDQTTTLGSSILKPGSQKLFIRKKQRTLIDNSSSENSQIWTLSWRRFVTSTRNETN